MKAIIIFTLLFVASQAFYINATAYHLGFSDELGLNASQLKDASVCYAAGEELAQDIQNAIVAAENQETSQFLTSLSSIVADIQTSLPEQCAPYRADLLNLMSENANGANLQVVAQQNMRTYAVQLIQQVAIWAQQYAHEESYEAGKTEAYIFQILFGLEKPAALNISQFNFSNYVPFNQGKFYSDFYEGYLTTLGVTNQTEITIIANCANVYTNATQTISLLGFQVNNESISKVKAITQAVEIISEAVESCVDAWRIQRSYMEEIKKALPSSKLQVALQLLSNIGLNLPEIVQEGATFENEILAGNYEQAGVDEADIAKIIFTDLIRF